MYNRKIRNVNHLAETLEILQYSSDYDGHEINTGKLSKLKNK